AAVFLRDQRREEAGVGERRHELAGIGALAIERPPVLARKIRAQGAHRLADLRDVRALAGSRAIVHHLTSARPLFMATTLRYGTSARKLTTAPSRHISVRMVSPGNTGAENRPAIEASRFGS